LFNFSLFFPPSPSPLLSYLRKERSKERRWADKERGRRGTGEGKVYKNIS